jgi:hypothetical protein
MKTTAYVHIGLEKTGTTTLQYFMQRNEPLLEQQGLYYPKRLGNVNHIHLAAYAQDSDKIDEIRQSLGIQNAADVLRFREKVEESLASELAATAPAVTNVVFSNEHIHSRLTRLGEVQLLRELIQRHCETIKIVVYLRRQDKIAVSLYSTLYRAGAIGIQPVFINQQPMFYDYYAILDMYARVFGRENVIIRILEPARLINNNLLDDFSNAVGLNLEGRTHRRPPPLNVSLTPDAIQFLAEFNRHVPWLVDGKVNKYRADILAVIDARFCGQAQLVSRGQAEEFYSRFKEMNERTREHFLPEIHPSLFTEDFDLYPEKEPLLERNYEDAVRIAAELWKFMVDELEREKLRSSNETRSPS